MLSRQKIQHSDLKVNFEKECRLTASWPHSNRTAPNLKWFKAYNARHLLKPSPYLTTTYAKLQNKTSQSPSQSPSQPNATHHHLLNPRKSTPPPPLLHNLNPPPPLLPQLLTHHHLKHTRPTNNPKILRLKVPERTQVILTVLRAPD